MVLTFAGYAGAKLGFDGKWDCLLEYLCSNLSEIVLQNEVENFGNFGKVDKYLRVCCTYCMGITWNEE